jgi:AcrR family transcriptional regulator
MSERRRRDHDRGRPPGDGAPDRDLRPAMERALLQVSGEVGYEAASVAAVVGRSGSNLVRFYRAYLGKSDCYAAAYESAAEDLCGRLLDACRQAPDWSTGMKRALLELDTFAADDPALARGVLTEVHVAGGKALKCRTETVARLSRAVDLARRDAGDRPPPPASTARFVVASIESAVVRALTEKIRLREILPALLFIAVASYFDIDEAQRQVRGWPRLD